MSRIRELISETVKVLKGLKLEGQRREIDTIIEKLEQKIVS